MSVAFRTELLLQSAALAVRESRLLIERATRLDVQLVKASSIHRQLQEARQALRRLEQASSRGGRIERQRRLRYEVRTCELITAPEKRAEGIQIAGGRSASRPRPLLRT